MPILPDRQALRALYDEAVTQINTSRPSVNLTTGFYANTGNSVFEAGYLALSDYCAFQKSPKRLVGYNGFLPPQRLHVVSAPAGGGKTSFSYALMIALTRYAEKTPDAPHGCILVVDQIKKADDAYRELNELMPGKVAVWTTEHARGSKKKNKPLNKLAVEFSRDELERYPIVVVTHAFYNGPNGTLAHHVIHNGHFKPARALVVVDERPEEVELFETTLKDAQAIREKIEAKHPETKEPFDALMQYCVMPYTLSSFGNAIRRPSEHPRQADFADKLQWFTTGKAENVLRDHAVEITGLDRLFGFAKAVTVGCAFAAPSGHVVRFVGWRSKLVVRPGTILLDATADIDGVSHICPWREHVKVPHAQYGNLDIIHVPQHTKKRLSEYLKTASNQRAYVEWMVETIKDQMAPGEQGLVICKKALFDAERIPQWPEGDPRFKDPDSYTKRYEWDIEGRELCAIHWGTGIGSNNWKDADAVFLFDEFFIPRRIAAATVQGLRGHRADEGDLGSMTTLNSTASGVDRIADGHRLRWTKQLALRGRGRSYDEHGNCGKQRLVVSSDLKSFMASAHMLFPGAKITTVGEYTQGATWGHKVIEILNKPEMGEVITTKQLAKLLRRPWRFVSSNVLTPEFENALVSMSWRYVTGKGRNGSRFERVTPDHSMLSEMAKESERNTLVFRRLDQPLGAEMQ